MESRQRVLKCLRHEEPDRVPADFWSAPEVVKHLLEYLCISDEEALLKYLGIDFRYVRGPSYAGQEFKVYDDGTVEDLWGVRRRTMTIERDPYRWTYKHVVSSPLESARTGQDIDGYKRWPSPDWWDYTDIPQDCDRFAGYAVVNAGDRLDRTAQLKPAMYLRGMEQIFVDLHQNPEVAEAIFSHIKDYFLEYNKRVFDAAKGKIDIFMMGDDFGTQNGPMMSVEMWRRYFKRGFREYIDLAHKYNLKVMHHTCGSVRYLIGEFIDCGLDILQSIQPRAEGMDLAGLKKEYGKYISFHGSIDIQNTLPNGRAEDVRREVEDRMRYGKPGGGFIIGPAHNIQPDTPAENILALYKACKEFGKS